LERPMLASAARPRPRGLKVPSLVVHVVVAADAGGFSEFGVFRDRALAERRARLLGHSFGVVEVAVRGARPDQESVWSGYEYDRMLDFHHWAGRFAAEYEARAAV